MHIFVMEEDGIPLVVLAPQCDTVPESTVVPNDLPRQEEQSRIVALDGDLGRSETVLRSETILRSLARVAKEHRCIALICAMVVVGIIVVMVLVKIQTGM